MTAAEIHELRRLAGAFAIEATSSFEDVTGLASALVRRYLATFEDSLADYEASWDATRTDPYGCTGPEWAALDVRTRARYIGLEIAQCAAVMLKRIENAEAGIHDVMPDAWEIGREL